MTLLLIRAAALVVLLGAGAFAQIRDRTQHETVPDSNQSQIAAKKQKHGPRAIGVVEFLPGGRARLVPVALWMDGRFYDAGLYGANPAPFAIEPGTVYEATDYGEPAGLFTVSTPTQVKGNWIADGSWKARQALDEKLAAQAAKQPKAKPSANADDDRPVLRRPGSSGSGTSKDSTSGAAGATAQSAPAPGSSPAQEDPNRPTLKKPSEAAATTAASGPAATASASSATSSSDRDPNRPVLRRGAGEQTQQATTQSPTLPAGNSQPAAGAANNASAIAGNAVRRSYPAVSDAGPYETRSLLYSMTREEREAKTRQMCVLALEEIRKFVAARHTPALPNGAAVTESDFRSYDLDYSNTPTLVLTGKLLVPGTKAFRAPHFEYFVTLVAREDINGEPIKIFSSVSDSNHLDAFPRMEIIDALDADANGRGDLLFRQYSDTGVNYSLYRVFPYDMQKVFEGGSGE